MNLYSKILNWLLADDDRLESMVAFFTGDIMTVYVSYHLCWVNFEFAEKLFLPIILAILTGFFGGAFAILGKIFIKWLFKKKPSK